MTSPRSASTSSTRSCPAWPGSSGWFRSGVKTIQLRLKDVPADVVRREIAASLEVCARHGCQLIVNDYWREALDLGADFVHLGQEDLAGADVPALKAKGVRLGISTHSHEELATALAARPDYVALGPIYETKLKVMKWAPQGLEPRRRVEAPHRRTAPRGHRRHHARASRGRDRGRRRQRCRHHRFLDQRRPGGTRPPMACMGKATQPSSFLEQDRF